MGRRLTLAPVALFHTMSMLKWSFALFLVSQALAQSPEQSEYLKRRVRLAGRKYGT